MDPVINSVLQSPLARNLNHIATDSTQFTYHVEQNAPPLSLKKGYIDSSQSFVGFDNTYTFTLPQWGYLAKNILRLQYQIKPVQRTHVTPVLPMYHMIDKVELMSHNNVIETLYGDSIMIKHAYYSESCCAATKMMGTLNVPPECGNYVDISALFRNSTDGTPFNPFDHKQWNNSTNVRTVTLFLELPFSFTDNPAMYFDTRFVEYLTVQVKLSSTKHGLPLFQAACAVELDMGDDNIQLEKTNHKNTITSTTTSMGDNQSSYYEDKVNVSENNDSTGLSGTAGKSGVVSGCKKFFYRPLYTRTVGTGGDDSTPFQDGSFDPENDSTSYTVGVHAKDYTASSATSTWGMVSTGKGLDPFELQLGGRPGSRLPSMKPIWMHGFYPAADKNGIYACAHAGEPRFIRIGACNFSASDYTVGYWGFLATGAADKEAFGENPSGLSMNTLGVTEGWSGTSTATHEVDDGNGGTETAIGGDNIGMSDVQTTGVDTSTLTGGTITDDITGPCYSDKNIIRNAITWAQLGGKFVYDRLQIYGTGMAKDVAASGDGSGNINGIIDGDWGSNNDSTRKGEEWYNTTSKYWVNINTQTALIERFYAMYPYLNLSNQPTRAGEQWAGHAGNENFGHGHMATDSLVVEGSQNNASYEGLPNPQSVNMKLLVTYLSLHDRVREQVSMDNFKDNMPATILMHDTFQEYNGLIYGSPDSAWATETNQTMVVPIRSKNLCYAISIVAYRNKTNKELCGGGVYNALYDGNGCERSKMDISVVHDQMDPSDGCRFDTDITKLHGKVASAYGGEQIENHIDGDIPAHRRTGFHRSGEATVNTKYWFSGTKAQAWGDGDTLTRWNGRKKSMGLDTSGEGAKVTELNQSASSSVVRPADGSTIAQKQSKGPCILSDPTFVWPNYKVVENFKTVKPTHVKLSIAGQAVYETAQQTALANSYYSTTSDSYTPVKGGGQWFVEKDLDNLPYHYNQGAQSRGNMGSVARLPNIVGNSEMGGTIQEHCDAHVVTFGLNKTDQLSNNGALGLSSATNAQLELKFAEPCRVSIYVHYHATLQIDSNTGVMSRSLDV